MKRLGWLLLGAAALLIWSKRGSAGPIGEDVGKTGRIPGGPATGPERPDPTGPSGESAAGGSWTDGTREVVIQSALEFYAAMGSPEFSAKVPEMLHEITSGVVDSLWPGYKWPLNHRTVEVWETSVPQWQATVWSNAARAIRAGFGMTSGT